MASDGTLPKLDEAIDRGVFIGSCKDMICKADRKGSEGLVECFVFRCVLAVRRGRNPLLLLAITLNIVGRLCLSLLLFLTSSKSLETGPWSFTPEDVAVVVPLHWQSTLHAE